MNKKKIKDISQMLDEADDEAYQCLDDKLTLLSLFEADKSNRRKVP